MRDDTTIPTARSPRRPRSGWLLALPGLAATILAAGALVAGLRAGEPAVVGAPAVAPTTASTAPPATPIVPVEPVVTQPPATTTTAVPSATPAPSPPAPSGPEPLAAPVPEVPAEPVGGSLPPDAYWDRMAQCETGGNWAHFPYGTWTGGLGIYNQTWLGWGGGEFAPTAGQATREQQILVANRIATLGYGGLGPVGYSAWGCLAAVGYP